MTRACGAALPAALVSAALLASCSDSGERGEGRTTPDAGTPDAGQPVGPLPLPVLRLDDPRMGTSHAIDLAGKVVSHGAARTWPASFGDLKPARVLSIDPGDGSTRSVYYTLPVPYGFVASVGEAVRVHYRERSTGFGSSHGLRVETAAGELRVIAEDGSFGPAFAPAERVGLEFTPEDVPLQSETIECGRKVRIPLFVKLAPLERRVDPGETQAFALPGGAPVELVLLDSWRLEDSLCGQAPEFSLGYLVRPPL